MVLATNYWSQQWKGSQRSPGKKSPFKDIFCDPSNDSKCKDKNYFLKIVNIKKQLAIQPCVGQNQCKPLRFNWQREDECSGNSSSPSMSHFSRARHIPNAQYSWGFLWLPGPVQLRLMPEFVQWLHMNAFKISGACHKIEFHRIKSSMTGEDGTSTVFFLTCRVHWTAADIEKYPCDSSAHLHLTTLIFGGRHTE